MTTSHKATAFVLVPGGWHVPAHFDSTVQKLQARGLEARAVDLFSVSAASDPGDALTRDTEAVVEAIRSFTHRGIDVAILGHSYGSIPGCEAAAIVSDDKHEGKVTRLIIIAGAVQEKGEALLPSTVDLREIVKRLGSSLDDDGLMSLASDTKDVFFHDASDEHAKRAVELLKPMAVSALTEKTRFAGWKDYGLPVTWIVCEQDRRMSVKQAEEKIEKLKELGMNVKNEELESGHCPMVSNVDGLVDVLVKAADLRA